MKFTQIPSSTFEELQLNAGILLTSFTPATGSFEKTNIIGATSGGVTFVDTPTYKDFGEGIDNCPKNTKELKRIESREIKLSGTYASFDTDIAKSLIASCDVAGTMVTPRRDLKTADFSDIWWVGDYSDKNGDTNGGFVAIKLLNALSTGGLSITASNNEKGKFAFEYTAHSSISNPDIVPYEMYIKSGTAEPTAQASQGST